MEDRHGDEDDILTRHGEVERLLYAAVDAGIMAGADRLRARGRPGGEEDGGGVLRRDRIRRRAHGALIPRDKVAQHGVCAAVMAEADDMPQTLRQHSAVKLRLEVPVPLVGMPQQQILRPRLLNEGQKLRQVKAGVEHDGDRADILNGVHRGNTVRARVGEDGDTVAPADAEGHEPPGALDDLPLKLGIGRILSVEPHGGTCGICTRRAGEQPAQR